MKKYFNNRIDSILNSDNFYKESGFNKSILENSFLLGTVKSDILELLSQNYSDDNFEEKDIDNFITSNLISLLKKYKSTHGNVIKLPFNKNSNESDETLLSEYIDQYLNSEEILSNITIEFDDDHSISIQELIERLTDQDIKKIINYENRELERIKRNLNLIFMNPVSKQEVISLKRKLESILDINLKDYSKDNSEKYFKIEGCLFYLVELMCGISNHFKDDSIYILFDNILDFDTLPDFDEITFNVSTGERPMSLDSDLYIDIKFGLSYEVTNLNLDFLLDNLFKYIEG